ncbi:glycoside hydrolase family 12 protein [Boletus edulis BED1]|uniref:Glycoside hydrolase family 12 protein n=1 Tax=Boletus edulis BED1 TaxID=1328754 RepID=A0AAD4GB44_BOLED|nr:glycoside hydrolase family 12 protein [Boletus edulis BED1]
MFLSFAFVTCLFALARGRTTLTGQWTCLTRGNYELCNNQWGMANGIGNQSATLISTSGNDISWSTTYTWADNESDVKSYTNVESTTAKGMPLCDITSAPTTWNWEYVTKTSGVHADVAYDIWIGTTPNGAQASSTSSYEIMIWLSSLGGASPLGSLQSEVYIAGYTWNPDGHINDFSADLNDFFTWIIDNQGVSSSLYLQAIESGTEPFIGCAELLTNCYSVSVTTAH